MGSNFYSPLRYPGGKTRLAPFVKSLFYENRLVGCHYVEPFAGGAGVALSLLFEEFASTITINDYDRSIYAFWHSVVNESDRFCREIVTTPITVENWKIMKERRFDELQKPSKDTDLFSLGFSTFFLNRTNVSGVIKGGVIGGLSQEGKYKLSARYNRNQLVERVKRIGKYRNRITVKCNDALKLLPTIDKGFVYLDPPYVKQSKGLYMSFYNERNHEDIAKFLLSRKPKFTWLLSYDKDLLISKLYRKCRTQLNWNVGYGSSNRKGSELLFVHNKLKIVQSRSIIES